MKAVVVESTGGLDALTYKTDHPTPASVPAGHVLVKNEYAGLNYIDTYHRSGLYPLECPFVLGQEGGGTICKLPENTSNNDLKIGDRVVYGVFGAYAEYTLVPISKIIPVPNSLDMKTGIACMTQGLTAHYLSSSVNVGIAKPGDWVLVYSVGSGTCQWAAQMLKLRGYRVIGTTSASKVTNEGNNFGCDHVIVLQNEPGKSYASYASVDIAAKVMELTNGNGCKLVIDGVGKSTYEISLKCLAKRARSIRIIRKCKWCSASLPSAEATTTKCICDKTQVE